MRLVEKHIILLNNTMYKEIDKLCFLSKNLYNVGLYAIRQYFFEKEKFLNYEKLQKKLQTEKQVDYYALSTKVSQQILKTLCKNFESFFSASKEYKKNPGKFKARPKLPKYKHKTKGRNIVVYPIDAINTQLLELNQVKLSMSEITVPCRQKHIKQARLIPCYGVYKIEIVYEKSCYLFCEEDITKLFIEKLKKNSTVTQYLKEKFCKTLQKQIDNNVSSKALSKRLKKSLCEKLNSLLKTSLYDEEVFKNIQLKKETKKLLSQSPTEEELLHLNRLLLENTYPKEINKHKKATKQKLEKDYIAGIDIGLDNLAAITSNQKNFKPVLINGRPLKSINQYFNKKRSRLMSFIGGKGTSKKIQNLTHKRNCIIENYLHQSSRYIINLLLEHRIGTLIIGKNDGWKQQINIGKKNNQNFVSIPHAQFIQQLQYKAQLVGINVILTEESYTSKCSFLDKESIKKHEKYVGHRIKRGLFRSRHGISINADINGSANIIRKVIPNAFANGIEGIVVFPKRIYPFKVKCNI